MDAPNTFPQRVECRHCGKSQVESVDANGSIYVLPPGSQFSRGPGGRRRKSGAKLLRANAEAHRGAKYPPNVPIDKRRDELEEDE